MRRILPVMALLLAMPLFAEAKDDDSDGTSKRRFPRVRLGGIMVNAGYTRWSGWGPGYWGPWGPAYGFSPWYGFRGSMFAMGPGWWDPWFYGGGFYPGFITGYPWAADKGEVKLAATDKTAQVYIDGAFAGNVGKLKSMWLDPGAYQLEIRAAGTDSPQFQKKIYVLSGKSLKLETR